MLTAKRYYATRASDCAGARKNFVVEAFSMNARFQARRQRQASNTPCGAKVTRNGSANYNKVEASVVQSQRQNHRISPTSRPLACFMDVTRIETHRFS